MRVLKRIGKDCLKYLLQNNRISKIILSTICENSNFDYFMSYHFRPKSIKDINDDNIKVENDIKMGIIIQGPLLKENNFTLETIKLYKKLYENTEIILSIWEEPDKEYLKLLKKENIHIIENMKPFSGGFININYQISNTKSAVLKAKELNCKYVMKTRTDCRVYDSGVKNFLISMLNQFPSRNENSLQKDRMIGIDINTHKYGIGISDVFQFGSMEEMEKMWTVSFYEKTISREEYCKNIEKKSNAIDRYHLEFSECYLLKRYMEKNKILLKPTLESYYKVLKENFIIIDASMINLYWNKYLGDEYKGWKNYERKIANSAMSFRDWFTIFSNEEIIVNEDILKQNYEFWKNKRIDQINKGEE